MKRTSQPAAIAKANVEIYDADARGLYAEGQAIEDARASILLARYPYYFKAGAPAQAPKEGEE